VAHLSAPLGAGGIGQPERVTQNRVIALFRDELHYRYLGDFRDRDGNTNIETSLLTPFLTRSGYSADQVNRAIGLLCTEADNHSRGLYGNNKAVLDHVLVELGPVSYMTFSFGPQLQVNTMTASIAPSVGNKPSIVTRHAS
jgi:hypothetical protein